MRLIDADRLRKEIERLKAAAEGWSREYACGITAGLSMAQLRVGEAPTIAPPPNEPLSVEELREMEVDIPIWIERDKRKSKWEILSHRTIYGLVVRGGTVYPWESYGEEWTAYRHKPDAKEDESDA